MDWQESDVKTNGITLHSYRGGDESQPLIILAHGFGDNGPCWQRTAQRLSQRYAVLMFDARNHGLSSRAPASTTEMVEDLAGLIRSVSPKTPVILLGHSMGASTAAGVAARYPELVQAALLEDPPWLAASETVLDEAQRTRHREKREAGFRQFLADLKAKPDLLAYGRELYPDWHDDDLPAWAESKMQVAEDASKGLELSDWQAEAGSIEVPTLLIHTDGKRDGLLKAEIAAELSRSNANLTSAEIAGAGHNIRRENFTDYLAAVETYLAAAT